MLLFRQYSNASHPSRLLWSYDPRRTTERRQPHGDSAREAPGSSHPTCSSEPRREPRPDPAQTSIPRRPLLPGVCPNGPGVVVRSASNASENGPCTPVGSERGTSAAPTRNCRFIAHRPRLGARTPVPGGSCAVKPNRMSQADTMAPASRSTVVRPSDMLDPARSPASSLLL